jgi:hypothetical protein
MTNKKLFTITGALLCASLAGCSGSADEPAVIENAAEPEASLPEQESTPAAAPNAAATESATVNLADEVLPDVAPAPDEQMMDDAAAAGMTARTSREEAADDEAELGVPTNQN